MGEIKREYVSQIEGSHGGVVVLLLVGATMWVDNNTPRYVWVKILLSDPKEQFELLQTGFLPYTPADAYFLPLKKIEKTANPTHVVNGCPTWSISNPAGGLRALLRTKVLKKSDPNPSPAQVKGLPALFFSGAESSSLRSANQPRIVSIAIQITSPSLPNLIVCEQSIVTSRPIHNESTCR